VVRAQKEPLPKKDDNLAMAALTGKGRIGKEAKWKCSPQKYDQWWKGGRSQKTHIKVGDEEKFFCVNQHNNGGGGGEKKRKASGHKVTSRQGQEMTKSGRCSIRKEEKWEAHMSPLTTVKEKKNV